MSGCGHHRDLYRSLCPVRGRCCCKTTSWEPRFFGSSHLSIHPVRQSASAMLTAYPVGCSRHIPANAHDPSRRMLTAYPVGCSRHTQPTALCLYFHRSLYLCLDRFLHVWCVLGVCPIQFLLTDTYRIFADTTQGRHVDRCGRHVGRCGRCVDRSGRHVDRCG